jgi:hypothetical protein
MLDAIIGLLELLCSSIWNFVGLFLGLAAAAVVWHLTASSSAQVELSALAYVGVFLVCVAIGARHDIHR